MLTHFGRIHLRPEWKESVVCIGTFDGVHRGHQQVIQTAVVEAARAAHRAPMPHLEPQLAHGLEVARSHAPHHYVQSVALRG